MFDYLLLLVFTLVQYRLSILWMRAARRRWTGALVSLCSAALVSFDLLVAYGYLCSWSQYSGHLGISPSLTAPLGAAALAYLLIATFLLAIHELKKAAARHFDAGTNTARRRAIQTTASVLTAAPFAVLGYGTLIERDDFRVREIDLPVTGLARDLEGLRVLHLSDIHLSAFLSEAELERAIDATAGLHPHLAVITGDLISSRGDPLDACIRQLARVKADAGVYGCLGNHERYAQVEDHTTSACARAGIRMLRTESCRLTFGNSVLNLAGVDYERMFHTAASKAEYLRGAERLVAPGVCNVLLSHNSDVFPVAAWQGYNLMLSGHTHGGQVTIEILDQSINAARFLTPYVYGVYHEGRATAYVTRGIGTIGLPTRLGCPPEISLLRLRRA